MALEILESRSHYYYWVEKNNVKYWIWGRTRSIAVFGCGGWIGLSVRAWPSGLIAIFFFENFSISSSQQVRSIISRIFYLCTKALAIYTFPNLIACFGYLATSASFSLWMSQSHSSLMHLSQ